MQIVFMMKYKKSLYSRNAIVFKLLIIEILLFMCLKIVPN